MKRLLRILAPFLLIMSVNAQTIQQGHSMLTGNLHIDVVASYIFEDSLASVNGAEPKSRFNAALYSAVVPGAGQLYNEGYLESAGFIAAEIGLWVVYAIYNSKGDKQTSEFQDFADTHWFVTSYAQWMKDNYSTESSSIVINPNTSLPPWERVDWDQLNLSEDQISRRSGTGFTHRLPRRPEQQYYELIGKYPQYGGGWDDVVNFTPSDLLQRNLSSRFLIYSQMRGDANDLYKIATTTSYFIIANHLLSAIEAAWGAARFNSRLRLEAHFVPQLRSSMLVEFVPVARMSLEF